MTDETELRNAASAILAKRLEQKLLMLTCSACGEYHEATFYKDFCARCQAGRKPT
jgi:uncharacterized OB-fold protein